MAELSALDAVTEAVESGAGLPEVVRAAARALDASLAVIDARGGTLAVAARSPAEERSLLAGGEGVTSLPLRVADAVVGSLHMRARTEPSASMRRLLVTMIASEVQRVRAPDLATESAAADFLHALSRRELHGREAIVARARELSLDLAEGASVIVARAHPQAPTEEGWRARVRVVAERGARAAVSRSIAALTEREGAPVRGSAVARARRRRAARRARCRLGAAGAAGGRPRLHLRGRAQPHRRGPRRPVARRLRGAARRERRGGREHRRWGRGHPHRGAGQEGSLAFEQTGAYRLLLSTMSENPRELQRFYAETVEPLVAYDEQYETDLVRTLGDLPRRRRQRRGHRPTPVHPPPHDLLPP